MSCYWYTMFIQCRTHNDIHPTTMPWSEVESCGSKAAPWSTGHPLGSSMSYIHDLCPDPDRACVADQRPGWATFFLKHKNVKFLHKNLDLKWSETQESCLSISISWWETLVGCSHWELTWLLFCSYSTSGLNLNFIMRGQGPCGSPMEDNYTVIFKQDRGVFIL